jgi:AmmeMemoRadiSam system protein B
MKKTTWFVIATTVCIICIMDCHADTDKAEIIREPAVAGFFYPADGEELQAVVDKHLDNVVDLPRINGQIIGLIAPHAGLVYSGQIAAYSYKILQNSGVNKVILIGPSHRFPFEGISVFGPGVRWRTPLGMID